MEADTNTIKQTVNEGEERRNEVIEQDTENAQQHFASPGFNSRSLAGPNYRYSCEDVYSVDLKEAIGRRYKLTSGASPLCEIYISRAALCQHVTQILLDHFEKMGGYWAPSFDLHPNNQPKANHFIHKMILTEEVIITNLHKRGIVKNNTSTLRNITQVYSKSGNIIAESDPWGNFTQEDLVDFAKFCSGRPADQPEDTLREWLKTKDCSLLDKSLGIPL